MYLTNNRLCDGPGSPVDDCSVNTNFRVINGSDPENSSSAWMPRGHIAKYCMSRKLSGSERGCDYDANIAIIVIVIVCNIGKLGTMLYVAYGPFSDPLMTTGDAVASYLERPDQATRGMCLFAKSDIAVVNKQSVTHWTWLGQPSSRTPKKWKPEKTRWFVAASVSRWFWCFLL